MFFFSNFRVVSESHLERVISREEVVVVLFIDESIPNLNAAIKKSCRDLELAFGLAVVDVTDLQGISFVGSNCTFLAALIFL